MNIQTEQLTNILTDRYGPFLTINQLAEVLDRSPNGLRISLQKDGVLSRQLNGARKKIGRRVYFNAISIAEIMTDPEEH